MYYYGMCDSYATAMISYPETKISPKDIVAAASVALQEQEYPVMTVNENIGLVTTDWKNLTSTGSQIAQALLAGQIYHTRMNLLQILGCRNDPNRV